MRKTSSKTIYDNKQTWRFLSPSGSLLGAYVPNCPINDVEIWNELSKVDFRRVHYISQYHKPNRTPRLTYAYGQIDANMPNPEFNPATDKFTKLQSIPNPDVKDKPHQVLYRGLNFHSEVMPEWLERLAQFCRMMLVLNYGFDPGYNSAIIGKYQNGDDQIGFHTDDEGFLAHHLCANVTLGYARDFQFKTVNPDGSKQTHEICLDHKSVFFFFGLEHALPKRAGVKDGEVRYSISFRNMASNIGIGNSFYYCRGLQSAIDDEKKQEYEAELKRLQIEKGTFQSTGMSDA